MDNIIVITILVIIISSVSYYIYKEKKNGATCIGCPHSKQCTSKGNCNGVHSERNFDNFL